MPFADGQIPMIPAGDQLEKGDVRGRTARFNLGVQAYGMTTDGIHFKTPRSDPAEPETAHLR